MKSPAAPSLTEDFIRLRLLVGFLGQRKQHNWWDCSFLDPTGLQFLATTFPRTSRLAGLRSVSEAACRVHDQALGRGAFHLFRLPLPLEDRLEEIAESIVDEVDFEAFTSMETAISELHSIAGTQITAGAGPVQIGVEKKILTPTSLTELSAHYALAFTQGIRCFPYFASDLA
ncbi:MAG: BrxE family protein [Verrucomicrobiae bacterium]|nr:BrxE family protein [Verrucomicrobiae bacterium]